MERHRRTAALDPWPALRLRRHSPAWPVLVQLVWPPGEILVPQRSRPSESDESHLSHVLSFQTPSRPIAASKMLICYNLSGKIVVPNITGSECFRHHVDLSSGQRPHGRVSKDGPRGIVVRDARKSALLTMREFMNSHHEGFARGDKFAEELNAMLAGSSATNRRSIAVVYDVVAGMLLKNAVDAIKHGVGLI